MTNKQALSVLLIEDHDALRELIEVCISEAGYQVMALDCAEALSEVQQQHWFAAFIDINLSGEDGLSVAKRLRMTHPNLRIAMLTARNSVTDRVMAYELGADIFLNKPFEPNEVLAILANWSKRTLDTSEHKLAYRLDMEGLSLSYGEAVCDVSRNEAQILRHLALAPDRQLAYWQLLELLNWELNDENLHRLMNKIYRLRKKLAPLTGDAHTIKSIRNEGYNLQISLVVF